MDTAPRPVPGLLPGNQLSFEDVGPDLADEVFVVVDLETTGGPAAQAGITEIGAVKVHGGQIVGEFATLVRPAGAIPAHITALTGIDDALVHDAPSVAGAVASFGEFAGDAILVAHNAPYDLGFLKAACTLHELSWFPGRSLDTARLARVALLPGEVRNCTLATLAAHFQAPTTPNHRALADARATSHVLHCLLERVGSFGVRTFADLRDFLGRVSPAQRSKRHLTEGLPTGPGVYTFLDRQGAPLYVGTSTNVRSRVRSYFTAAENRARMSEMIAIAQRVEVIPCATPLEAHVREIRQISSHRPHYNRRSRQADTSWWLSVRTKPVTRLVAVHSKNDASVPENSWGPFPTRGAARRVATDIAAITSNPATTDAPPSTAIADQAASIQEVVAGDLRALLATGLARMQALVDRERFEQAARLRDALASISAASQRHQRFQLLRATEQVVAAEPDSRGGWAIHVICAGRLVAAVHAPPGTDPKAAAWAAVATAESAALASTTAEESILLARWLEHSEVRLVHVSTPLAWPIGSGSFLSDLRVVDDSHARRETVRPVGPAPGRTRVTRIAG